ncbi:MAG: sigma-70 family RNA polymerase sigma factor [Thermoguttaceae bacterium]|nr:sigma-70 family RNA polymerase sigma factor [Thermoguttaceae bacterium]
MALSEIDRNLLERCLKHKPRAWEDFVDRFLGLILHVIKHTAQARGIRLSAEERDDLCGEVFLHLLQDDFAILRHFRGQSSLATYLTVVARRIVVRRMLAMQAQSTLGQSLPAAEPVASTSPPETAVVNREEVERLLSQLDGVEAQIVRMFHLEGKSYQEISQATGLSENSIGPILSRARAKLRSANSASSSH